MGKVLGWKEILIWMVEIGSINIYKHSIGQYQQLQMVKYKTNYLSNQVLISLNFYLIVGKVDIKPSNNGEILLAQLSIILMSCVFVFSVISVGIISYNISKE